MPPHLLLCLHASRLGLQSGCLHHVQDAWRETKRDFNCQASFAVFGPPVFPSPLFVSLRQSFAQEVLRTRPCCIDKKLLLVKGEDGYGKEDVAPTRLCLLRVARTLLLVLGVGVFLTLQFPTWAAPKTAVPGPTVAQAVGSVRISEILTSGWTGLLAGCLHALTGPDHLAALAPLCIGRAKLESAVVGALWGCGHDAGQVIFGLAFLLLKGRLHIELVRTWAARVVGVTLLAIGGVGLKEAQEVPLSILADGGASSTYPAEAVGSRKNTQRLRTFATGLVYGLQPDALIMILPALALPSRLAGAAYLGMFLLGTIVAMGSYTAFIGSCGNALQKRLPWITRRLAIGSSLIAIAFGLGVLVGELFGLNIF